MTYYIQERDLATGRWFRLDESGPFTSLLEALEVRDTIRANEPNDGLHRAWRVVDEEGHIRDYQEGGHDELRIPETL